MRSTLAFQCSAEEVHMTQKGDSQLIHGTSNQEQEMTIIPEGK